MSFFSTVRSMLPTELLSRRTEIANVAKPPLGPVAKPAPDQIAPSSEARWKAFNEASMCSMFSMYMGFTPPVSKTPQLAKVPQQQSPNILTKAKAFFEGIKSSEAASEAAFVGTLALPTLVNSAYAYLVSGGNLGAALGVIGISSAATMYTFFNSAFFGSYSRFYGPNDNPLEISCFGMVTGFSAGLTSAALGINMIEEFNSLSIFELLANYLLPFFSIYAGHLAGREASNNYPPTKPDYILKFIPEAQRVEFSLQKIE